MITSGSRRPGPSIRQRLSYLVADVLTVVVFVAIGRRNHDEDVDASGVLDVAAPFLLALALVWSVLAVVQRRRSPIDPVWGLSTWVGTLALGMVLRKVAFDGGTATAFVIVATLFLGAGLNGWRAIARSVARRRAAVTPSS